VTRLGYQIPNFTYPGVPDEGIFDAVVAQAKAAEESGFDRILLMDHFHQLPGIGDLDSEIFECYTMLAAIAQHTSSVRLSALVTGNTYRNPAILAKTVTTLDHASHGRATLGIGSGWFEQEHDAYGIPFNTFSERFEKLEEALNIILPMLREGKATFSGDHYTVTEAFNSPPPMSQIPVMIGGSGEKKTLRMVAQYADESNLTCAVDEIPRKLDALAAHCERLGRDRSEIAVTKLMNVAIGNTHDEAVAAVALFIENHGWPAELLDMVVSQIVLGDPSEVGEQIGEAMAAGLDGITLNLVANAHDPEMVALAGRTADAAIG
jgi:F420-dependent oxidoreductase-like protein